MLQPIPFVVRAPAELSETPVELAALPAVRLLELVFRQAELEHRTDDLLERHHALGVRPVVSISAIASSAAAAAPPSPIDSCVSSSDSSTGRGV
jgi:hypothetical protein